MVFIINNIMCWIFQDCKIRFEMLLWNKMVNLCDGRFINYCIQLFILFLYTLYCIFYKYRIIDKLKIKYIFKYRNIVGRREKV